MIPGQIIPAHFRRSLLLALGFLVPSIAFQAPGFVPRTPGWGRPISELPAHVQAQIDQLTLFADFEHPEGETVPVYLINRTLTVVPTEMQDLNPYLKLEYESQPGVWTRAQTHYFSWCGNSYMFLSLYPDRFIVFSGKRVTEGAKVKVRYRVNYQDFAAVSNVGEGLVDLQEVEFAATDEMALRGADFLFLKKVALGESGISAANRLHALRHLVRGDFDSLAVGEVLEITAGDADEHVSEYSQRLLRRHPKFLNSKE